MKFSARARPADRHALILRAWNAQDLIYIKHRRGH
ncbi:hypothetical protein U724_02995 [Pseudomonas chlororaphis subsp. aurantiaca PB-St2]|nr:hypothetical protein U724_02995 [Pseudomonas chlororaphis subsp. aurantiaca PB-St2]